MFSRCVADCPQSAEDMGLFELERRFMRAQLCGHGAANPARSPAGGDIVLEEVVAAVPG